MIFYSEKQIKFLKKHRRLPRRQLAELFNKRWRTSWSYEQIDSLCSRKKILTGRTGRFRKGHVPANKGTKGVMKANSGSFKKGNAANKRPLGFTRIDRDGYIWVKTAEPNVWRMKHVLVWEDKHGTLPAGLILRFIDGNSLNCRIDNLEPMNRNLHGRLNKLRYKNAPTHIKPSLKIIATIQARCSDLKR